GRARFVPVVLPTAKAVEARYPLTLNTGRVRDHWHTMTRTAKSARLSAHLAEPFAEIHPADALRTGVSHADLVRVESATGHIVVRALITLRQVRGAVFVPMHWTDQVAANARVGTLIPAVTDPHSGQPASKRTPVRIQRVALADYGFAVLRTRPTCIDADYWVVAKCPGGWRVELGGLRNADDVAAYARALFRSGDDALLLSYRDGVVGLRRVAAFDDMGLVGALFVGPTPVAVSRVWAVEQLSADMDQPGARLRVLAGRAGGGQPDRGAIVCACFGVGQNEIVNAIVNGECRSVAEVGACLKAGTNCGSCRAEIKGILDATRLQAAE
ncbi:MAG: (2Fe-2S)-binding protein, partial [Alphaproteobacteria bacterium]|nr:(2Fe-2S)-binding protein [Alphaproteobacteria bacterium]